MQLMANEYGYNGIYRAILLPGLSDNDVRAFIPGITNLNPFKEDNTINLESYEQNKEHYPKVQFCCYNIESKEIINIKGPAWVMFENGNVRRPVCISYSVIGGGGISSNTENGTNMVFAEYGDWITKWMCTIYGNSAEDDNGILGWNGKNYHTINGCHVAIPMSCINNNDSNFPEFSKGYGTVLEVRNPKNGKSVIAVVADCGDFGPNGNNNKKAALDLPPNTQNALDVHDTQNIEYRYVGYINSWNGEQVITTTNANLSKSDVVNNAVKLGYEIINKKIPYVWGGKDMNGFDCSGYVWYCYHDSSGGNLSNLKYASTESMESEYTSNGFKNITNSISLSTGFGLIAGDILIRSGHTDMYAGSGKIIGAHSSSTGIYEKLYKGNYSIVLRYGG
mgnify:FL=1